MDAGEVDWETINEQLVYQHTEEAHARRRDIWTGMNVNDNKLVIRHVYVHRPYLRTHIYKPISTQLYLHIHIYTAVSRYLSLAEVDRGIRDVLGLDEVFDAKRAIFEAFRFAKNSSPVG